MTELCQFCAGEPTDSGELVHYPFCFIADQEKKLREEIRSVYGKEYEPRWLTSEDGWHQCWIANASSGKLLHCTEVDHGPNMTNTRDSASAKLLRRLESMPTKLAIARADAKRVFGPDGFVRNDYLAGWDRWRFCAFGRIEDKYIKTKEGDKLDALDEMIGLLAMSASSRAIAETHGARNTMDAPASPTVAAVDGMNIPTEEALRAARKSACEAVEHVVRASGYNIKRERLHALGSWRVHVTDPQDKILWSSAWCADEIQIYRATEAHYRLLGEVRQMSKEAIDKALIGAFEALKTVAGEGCTVDLEKAPEAELWQAIARGPSGHQLYCTPWQSSEVNAYTAVHAHVVGHGDEVRAEASASRASLDVNAAVRRAYGKGFTWLLDAKAKWATCIIGTDGKCWSSGVCSTKLTAIDACIAHCNAMTAGVAAIRAVDDALAKARKALEKSRDELVTAHNTVVDAYGTGYNLVSYTCQGGRVYAVLNPAGGRVWSGTWWTNDEQSLAEVMDACAKKRAMNTPVATPVGEAMVTAAVGVTTSNVGTVNINPSLKDPAVTDTKSTILQTLEADATDAAYRVAGSQMTKLAKEPLCALLLRNLGPGDESLRARIAAFLDTELGGTIVSGMLSAGLSAIPAPRGSLAAVYGDRLGRELRVRALSGAGDEIADVIIGPLRKVAVDYLSAPATGTVVDPATLPDGERVRIQAENLFANAERK